MNTFEKLSDVTGRVLISAIFLSAGISKLGDGYAGTQGYMEAMGVPGALLPLVIFAEIAGAAAVITGFLTRWAAGGLAVFSVLSAAIFHANFDDQMQAIMFWKNIAIAGGFLFLVARGAGPWSVDNALANR